jgi:hypothetical protein
MPCSIATLLLRLSTNGGATTLTNPVRVNTGGPPISSLQCVKIGKLAKASRASHSLV